MTYTVRIRNAAEKALARISPPYQNRIIEAIRLLSAEPRPHGVKKLTDRDGWRIRVGDYRIVYEIQDDRLVVLVIAVGHRGSIYR
jgi:mRNA interferase RelE/StbE